MNRIIYIFILASILGACGGGEKEEGVARLKAERDSIKSIYDELGEQLASLDERIANADTTRQLVGVSLYKVEPGPFEHHFSVQAGLEAEYNALVFPEISGVVKAVYAKEGDKVSKGQKLFQLDTELIRKSIQEVQTQYDLAVDIYNRQKNLWDQKIGSEIQYLEAKSRKESLENSMATLNEQLSMGTVVAPFNGVLDEIVPKIGEMASPAMPVARVINMSELYLKADVSESYLTSVKQGMNVEVVFPGIDTLSAAVSRIGDFINPENRSFVVRVDLKESNEYLKPNLLANITICDFKSDSSIVLPASMVLEDYEGRSFVYVAKASEGEGEVEKRIVQRGIVAEGMAQIVTGLNPGEWVVDKGARKVSDGERVRVIETTTGAETLSQKEN
jgi:RND family efflux transporter MFP subunit